MFEQQAHAQAVEDANKIMTAVHNVMTEGVEAGLTEDHIRLNMLFTSFSHMVYGKTHLSDATIKHLLESGSSDEVEEVVMSDDIPESAHLRIVFIATMMSLFDEQQKNPNIDISDCLGALAYLCDVIDADAPAVQRVDDVSICERIGQAVDDTCSGCPGCDASAEESFGEMLTRQREGAGGRHHPEMNNEQALENFLGSLFNTQDETTTESQDVMPSDELQEAVGQILHHIVEQQRLDDAASSEQDAASSVNIGVSSVRTRNPLTPNRQVRM